MLIFSRNIAIQNINILLTLKDILIFVFWIFIVIWFKLVYFLGTFEQLLNIRIRNWRELINIYNFRVLVLQMPKIAWSLPKVFVAAPILADVRSLTGMLVFMLSHINFECKSFAAKSTSKPLFLRMDWTIVPLSTKWIFVFFVTTIELAMVPSLWLLIKSIFLIVTIFWVFTFFRKHFFAGFLSYLYGILTENRRFSLYGHLFLWLLLHTHVGRKRDETVSVYARMLDSIQGAIGRILALFERWFRGRMFIGMLRSRTI